MSVGEALVKLQRGKKIPKKEGSGDRGRPHKVERKRKKGENCCKIKWMVQKFLLMLNKINTNN
jgi:hypothetical protein